MSAHEASAFGSLLDIIAPGDSAVVALAQVYVDESGTHGNSPMMSVAGTVMLKGAARKFSAEWSKHLGAEGIPFFHMTDLQMVEDHYADWDAERRDRHARLLIKLARKHLSFQFCVSANERDYNELGKGMFRVSCYSFLLASCVRMVEGWRSQSGFPGRLAFIFEAGHESAGEAGVLLNNLSKKFPDQYGRVSYSFVSKMDAPPLQAADMLAWLHRNSSLRYLQGKVARPDYGALIEPRRARHATLASWYYDRDMIRALVAAGAGRPDIADLLMSQPHGFLLPPQK